MLNYVCVGGHLNFQLTGTQLGRILPKEKSCSLSFKWYSDFKEESVNN
jgi:hypothetical protein